MATFKELKRYCENDGWELYKTTDHYFYKKVLDNGEVYRTKVSMNSKEIPSRLFQEILKNQLHVSKADFNKLI